MNSARRLGIVLAVAALVLVASAGVMVLAWRHFEHAPGHGPQSAPGGPPDWRGLNGPLNPQEMISYLGQLKHAEPGAVPEFDAAKFGTWSRSGRGGCEQKDRIIGAWLTGPRGGSPCGGQGTFSDPYTGLPVKAPDGVEVDHVVSLVDAWRSGAWVLDDARRSALFNDPVNLVATSRESHARKGDLAADRWQPVNLAYRCPYALRVIYTKWNYDLTVTDQEARALGDLASRCPASRAPEAPR